jgi:pimeloyl-ACP methyl ester carboxylesterase
MKLNFRKYGEGTPLIILHGVFGSSDNWQTLGKDFSEHFTTYLVDQRNHGKSPHSDTFDYEVMAEDINELMSDEGLDRAFIMGHSMGGKTAMKFASLYPEKVEKLIVVDISPRFYPPHHQIILQGFRSVNLDQLESRKQADDEMAEVIHSVMIRQFLLKNLSRDNNGFSWKINLDAIEANIGNIGKGLDEQEGYTEETLFIGGSKSDYITEADHADIKARFPKARIEMVDGAGHWVHAEKPRKLYELVVEFLS